MKELIKKGIFFVKNNPTIIYSLLLIFFMVGAIFLNSYFILTRFQENTDKALRTKAVLAEDILSVTAEEYFSDLSQSKEQFQEKITRIQQHDQEIVEISVYERDTINNKYSPIVSSKSFGFPDQENTENEKIAQSALGFAFSVQDAFAYLSNSNGNRFWNVTRAIKKSNGSVGGVLLFKLSLAQSDALVEKTIFQVYMLSVVVMVIVLLLIFNHIRLFAFELRAKKLEEVDKMKDDFISMASHELRSPLTAIRGYVELLGDIIETANHASTEKNPQKKYLKNIENSVSRLNNLVGDLLDVSRIQQNRIPFDLKETDVAEIVGNITNEMKVLANEKGLELKEEFAQIKTIKVDPERLKQIIVNLISNAIKYTRKGRVDVQIKQDDKMVYVIVADSGMGISAENMKKLFSKFYRIKTPETAEISGTGLGLWIAREMAQKMGGDLNVESIEGVGSHFTLSLKK